MGGAYDMLDWATILLGRAYILLGRVYILLGRGRGRGGSVDALPPVGRVLVPV